MNSCLYWRRPEDFNQWKHYIWHLVKGIRLLDKVTTTVYRGIYRSNFTLELYKSGKRVVWNSITSCSQIESHAKSFFMKVDEFSFSHNSHITLHFLPTTTHFVEKKDPSKGVFFSIKVSDGYKLGNLSAFPQEQEVLLEPGSEFVVTGSVCFNEPWVVNLEQTPSTNTIVPFSGLFVCFFLCCLFSCCDFFFGGGGAVFLRVFTVHRHFC